MTPNAPHFRRLARDSLARAKEELAANNPHRLRYAALELRDAAEALTYDRALAFADDIPPEEYKTWQPRKLMRVLVEIDPSINITKTISVGTQEQHGGRPASRDEIKTLGTDHVFTLADLKTHYDAIGSYLHMPSLQQVCSGDLPDPAGLRERCKVIIGLMEKVLSSQITNTAIGYITTLNQCMNDSCKKPVRKRMPVGNDTVEARCFECNAEYTITVGPGGGAIWRPKVIDVSCPTPGCSEKMQLWPHQFKPGMEWGCPGCGARNVIALCVIPFADGRDTNGILWQFMPESQ